MSDMITALVWFNQEYLKRSVTGYLKGDPMEAVSSTTIQDGESLEDACTRIIEQTHFAGRSVRPGDVIEFKSMAGSVAFACMSQGVFAIVENFTNGLDTMQQASSQSTG